MWHWVCNLRDINFQLRITYLIRIQRDWGNEFLVNVGGKLLNSFDCPFVRLENKIRSPNYNTLIKTTSIIPYRVLLSMFNPQMNIHRKNRITKADNKLIWIPTCSPRHHPQPGNNVPYIVHSCNTHPRPLIRMVANPYCCGAPAAVVALHWTIDHDERKNLLGLSFLHIIRPGSVFYIAQWWPKVVVQLGQLNVM